MDASASAASTASTLEMDASSASPPAAAHATVKIEIMSAAAPGRRMRRNLARHRVQELHVRAVTAGGWAPWDHEACED
jgi:hypothetical protein